MGLEVQLRDNFGTFEASGTRKGLVILTLVFSFSEIEDYANTYLAHLKTGYLPLYSITNTVLAIIVDSYLVYRFYTLSKTLFLYVLILLALVRFIPLVRGSTYADRDKAKNWCNNQINLITMVVCGSSPAVILLEVMTSKQTYNNGVLSVEVQRIEGCSLLYRRYFLIRRSDTAWSQFHTDTPESEPAHGEFRAVGYPKQKHHRGHKNIM
ncbi:hypothetical protein DFH08DRAFT_815495 [Mycena albidolilacea]|uniref:Uncharacterized protein n=1 Tax=Mycena albidolilacea TaxID=1033008 RepID=A0AAD6ZMI1_9AGAR|nr:hypothetical protein DFH08DRAFT_815495 [Mycena albidolilacea]